MTGLREQPVSVKKDVNFVRPEGTRSRPSIGRTDLEGGEVDKGIMNEEVGVMNVYTQKPKPDIVERTVAFSLNIIRLYRSLAKDQLGRIMASSCCDPERRLARTCTKRNVGRSSLITCHFEECGTGSSPCFVSARYFELS
jgi:hypothetical protein